MRFVVLLILFLIPTSRAYAILDFIGESVKETARAGVYINQAQNILSATSDSNENLLALKNFEMRASQAHTKAQSVLYLSQDLKNLKTENVWSSRSLERNLNFTSQFITRFKRLIAQSTALGAQFAVATNTAETNQMLNEVLKNQQTQILLNKEERLRKQESEIEKVKSWEDFIRREKAVRRGEK